MKRRLGCLAGLVVLGGLLIVALYIVYATSFPSEVKLHNRSDRAMRIELTDVRGEWTVWSGELAPGERRSAFVRFKGEGAPVIHCNDGVTTGEREVAYVTGHSSFVAEIAISDCQNLATTTMSETLR